MIRYAWLLLLAGCAFSQDDIRRDGTKLQRNSASPPSTAASCVARNLENAVGMGVTMREAADRGAYEGTQRAWMGNVIAHYLVTPRDKGSLITVWVGPNPGPQGLFDQAVKGC